MKQDFYVGEFGAIQPRMEGVSGWIGPYSWADAKAESRARAARDHARAAADAQADDNLTSQALPATPARFPSSPDTRRQILNAIATANGKYAKPFDKGKMSFISLIGTESWSEYGGVVLQMAILDTLLSVEEKLGALLEAIEPADEQPGARPVDGDSGERAQNRLI